MSLLNFLFGSAGGTDASAEAAAQAAIVVGSPSTIRYARALLRGARKPIRLVGCLTLNTGAAKAPRLRASLAGLRCFGSIDQVDVATRIHRIRIAYVCIPMAMHTLAARVAARLTEVGVEVRRIVTLEDQAEGRVGASGGTVDPASLLDRTPRPLDEDAIGHVLTGKRVLITGAGGSIGSDIARIVARFEPQAVALMERAENNLFEIDRWLASRCPDLQRRAMLHDVADAQRTASLVAGFRPHVVFHAAAHKHVPMMEDHPREAVVNNFFGTKSIADAAVAAGAERFVMISTDKAVNPTSVMGATKRLAELYVQELDTRADTRCSMVRFGNVLGSACSVVPIWTQQLAEGGPLTVTDPRMTRYFMTIPEAAALVIQAAALPITEAAETSGGGSIFLLDMGGPVRIIDMAERFIRLNGLTPRRDVGITLTGARPGEKLVEELAYGDEDADATSHPSVRRLRTVSPGPERVRWIVDTFAKLRHSDDRSAILAALRRAVPEMIVPAERLTDDTEVEIWKAGNQEIRKSA